MSRFTEHPRPGWRHVALAALALVLLSAAPAAAQDDDPYGGTTTTTEAPEVVPACELDLTAGAPGTQAMVTVTSVPAGGTVRILFAGDEVARGTAPLQGSTTLELAFTVPSMAEGRYLVTAVGADFTLTCSPGDGTFEILSASESRAPGASALPRTGVYAALFVVVALVLLVAGRSLLKASQRRRREAERRARRATRHRAGHAAGTRSAG